MRTNRWPIVLLLVLWPAALRASEHTIECFLGLSPEKQQAIMGRSSCGVRVYESTTIKADTGIGMSGGGTSGETGTTDDKVMKSAVFLVAEVAEYVTGTDSGGKLDNWTLGVRYIMLTRGTVEPFFQIMGGQLRPSRTLDLVATDATSPTSSTFTAGGGVDIETTRLRPGEKPPAIVPVVRVQLDGVRTGSGDDTHYYGRVTVGLSFRFEGHHK